MNHQANSRALITTLLAVSIISVRPVFCEPSFKGTVCQRVSPAVVTIMTPNSIASGFLITDDGWIVTSEDAVHAGPLDIAATKVDVVLQSGAVVPASHLFEPDAAGFALVKISGTYAYHLSTSDAGAAHIGDEVIIFGEAPTVSTFTGLCMAGLVAGRRSLTTPTGHIDLLFLQGSFTRSMSGAPVIELASGNVVGMFSHRFDTSAKDISARKDSFTPKRGSVEASGARNDLDVLRAADESLERTLGTAVDVTGVKTALEQIRQIYNLDHR